MKKIQKQNQTFEDIKHIDEKGIEYWSARELQKVLEYNKWENFEKVIAKAKIAYENTGISVGEHFPDVRKTIKMPKGAKKEITEKEYCMLTEDEKRFYQIALYIPLTI